MFYIIYKTTNFVNNKYYIGKHQTKNLQDGYLGSGIALKRAIKKYGRKNFYREIVMFCGSSEQMNKIERLIINEEIVKDRNSYNTGLGGQGGPLFCRRHTPEELEKMRQNRIYRHHSKETREKLRQSHKGMLGHFHSDETKRKISIALKGQKFSRERLAKLKGPKRKTTCPFCNDQISLQNFSRHKQSKH